MFPALQLVNTAAHSDALVGISATNAGDTTPTFQATISYQGGWLSGSAIASWGYTSWNYGYTSGSAPLSVIALSGNTAIVQHYITFTRVEVTRGERTCWCSAP